MEITLADVLTLAGAAIAAPMVTGLVEVLKRSLPRLVTGHEQAMALGASLLLVIAASLDRHQLAGVTTPSDVFVSFAAWLIIAKAATGVYDEIVAAPGSFRAP